MINPSNGKKIWVPREIEEGLKAVHDPAPMRARIYFPLAVSFTGERREWERAYKNFGGEVKYDRACVDMARAFYPPSRSLSCPQEETIFEYHAGERLNIYDFVVDEEDEVYYEEEMTPLDVSQLKDVFSRKFIRLRNIEDDNKFVSSFYHTFPRSFRLRRFLKRFSPQHIEGENEDGCETNCPFVRYHSSYGMKDGAFAQDAVDTGSFNKWGCRHDHSLSPPDMRFTTVTMLREGLSLGWYKRGDFFVDSSLFDRDSLLLDLGDTCNE